MSTETDKRPTDDDLSEAAYEELAMTLQAIAQDGLTDEDADVLTINNTLVEVVARVLGEMVGCYPEEEQPAVMTWAMDEVTGARAMMAHDLGMGVSAVDLLHMVPRGSC